MTLIVEENMKRQKDTWTRFMEYTYIDNQCLLVMKSKRLFSK